MFCTQCGFLNAAGARHCGSCGALLPGPAAVRPDEAVPSASPPQQAGLPQLARMGDRFLAVVLDTLLLAAAYAVLGVWAAARWGGLTESGFSMEGQPALIAISATLLAGFLYYWFAEALFGATLGKAILGIAVRRTDGGPCGLKPSLIRNLLRLVDGIGAYLVGLLIALLSRSRQRLGDRLAGTIVLERPPGAAARVALVVLWVVVIAAAGAGAYALHRAARPAGPAPIAAGSGDLRLLNLVFVEREDGPVRRPAPFERLELVYVKYDVAGFSRTPEGKADLQFRVEATDPGGLTLHSWANEFTDRVAAGSPVSGWFSVKLPPYAPPGGYTIRISVMDRVNTASLDHKLGFEVRGDPIAPASTLEIRDFELALARDGPAVSPLVLEGGGTAYMRWKMAGLQFRGDEMDVRVALKVYGPDGKLLLDEPSFVSERESVSYRPPGYFLSVSGRLNVPQGFAKGTYTAEFAAADNIAQVRKEWSAKFQVR